MIGKPLACAGALLALLSCHETPKFDGARAFGHLQAQVAFGPRLPGSEAHKKTRAYLLQELRAADIAAEEDPFVADAPQGKVAMSNVLATIPGKSKDAVLFAAHFDTKNIGTPPCPGANDGASSTALLLELARTLAKSAPRPLTLRFAFFDGEEAFQDWSETDSLYGSRHLVARWSKDGTLPRIKAMILFDMIGDADLDILRESLSSGWLVDMFRDAAKELGHSKHFFRESHSIEDDHRPFLAAGIPAIDLIDVSYGPRDGMTFGAYWHSPKDTVEHCSAHSLQIVGDVTLRALEMIEKRF